MSVQIRIIGTPGEVAEALRRHEAAFDVVGHSSQRPSRKNPAHVRVYLEAEVADRGRES